MNSLLRFRSAAGKKQAVVKAVGMAVFAALFCVGCGNNSTGGSSGKEDADPTYIITFDANGGTVTPQSDTTNKDGKLDSLPTPKWNGYGFEGWFFTAEPEAGDTAVDTGTVFTKDTTIYAQWTVITYEIDYELNGGTVSTANRTNYTVKTADFTLTKPTKKGYTFTGWTGSNGTDAETEVTVKKGSTGDKTYTANWTLIRHTIKFDANGGDELTAESGETGEDGTLESLPTPTRTGYTFEGWFTEKEDGDEVTEEITVFEGDATIYARWELIEYDITFDLNYTGAPAPTTVTTGDGWKLKALPDEPERKGYDFAGWFTEEEDGEEIDETTVFEEDATIYAQWTVTTYTIDYVLDGGTEPTPANPTSYTIETAAFTLNNPTKANFAFDGWTGSGITAAQTTVTIAQGSTGNKTFTATWTPIYTVTFNANGGDAVTPATAQTGAGGKLASLPRPTKTHYTFAGWFTAATGGTEVTEDTPFTEDATIFAQWTPAPYAITYVLNDGAVSPANPPNYTIETAAFTLNNPTKTGYTFAGWTGSNGETAQTSVTIALGSTGAKTFTANWTPTPYAITYELNGGTVSTATPNPTSYTIETATITLNNPTKANFAFDGWTGSGITAAQVTVTVAQGTTGNKTFTATWTPIYTVTFNANGGDAVTPATAQTGADGKLASLPKPTKTHYTFAGWFTAATDGTEVTEDTPFTEDATIFAQWTPTPYAITYVLNDGAVSTANPPNYTIETETFTLNNPTKTGYTFAGWTGSNGETAQTEVTTALGSTGAKTFTANWTVMTYTITYEGLDGAVLSTPNRTSYTIETAAFPLNNPTKTGYTFAGWTGSDITTPQTSVTIALGTTGDKAYTANWTITQYAITYEGLDGAVLSTPNRTSYTIETAEFTLTNPTKTGYTFAGWTGSNGESAQTSVTIALGSTGDRTFTANWAVITYTITYNLDGGTVPTATPNPPNYTIETAAFTLNNPTRAAHTFTGWTSSGITTPQTSVTIALGSTGDRTFTANWTFIPTFVDNRDAKTYNRVLISNQIWMAENLNYAGESGSEIGVCYDNNLSNCEKYGRLYNWATAMGGSSSSRANPSGVQGACPVGWHLPSDAEWTALTNAVGGTSTASKKLKSTEGWNDSGNGTDEFGFSALPGGIGYSGGFYGAGLEGDWWSATENGADDAWSRHVNYDREHVSRYDYGKTILFSVRCVQD